MHRGLKCRACPQAERSGFVKSLHSPSFVCHVTGDITERKENVSVSLY